YEKAVLLMLCHKESKLTGHEIRFVRLYFKMTLQVFASRFGVKHPTVLKWENFKDDPTNMSLGTEKDIRLYIIVNLIGQEKVGELYCELGNLQLLTHTHQKPIELDIERIAV